jgi:hypothetical protein
MENSLPVPKHERRWQFAIYTISILFMARDVFSLHHDWGSAYITDLFDAYRPYFLFVAFPLLCISWFVVLLSPRLGARMAIIAASISFMFYLGICVINLVNGPYYYFDVSRFYLPRIFLIGAAFIYSYKILQSPSEQAGFPVSIFFFKLRWTARRQRYILLAFVMAFGIVGIQWLYPRASCAMIGGRWVRDGMFGQAQYCFHSYPDAGKACHSSDDCMGRCLVDIDSSNATGAMPTAGVCAPDNRGYGCFSYFGDEAKYSGCVD